MFYSTFPQSEPLRVVELDNQFGRQTLLLREAVALAVPTEKRIPGPHPFPLRLDHFRCYGAWGAFANTSVWLSDQFITPFTGHFVLNPVSFCNPVQKRDVTGGVTPIQHPELHLTCYSMTRVDNTRDVSTRNQFGAQALEAGVSDRLCVPTLKVSVTEIPDGPIGASIDAVPIP